MKQKVTCHTAWLIATMALALVVSEPARAAQPVIDSQNLAKSTQNLAKNAEILKKATEQLEEAKKLYETSTRTLNRITSVLDGQGGYGDIRSDVQRLLTMGQSGVLGSSSGQNSLVPVLPRGLDLALNEKGEIIPGAAPYLGDYSQSLQFVRRSLSNQVEDGQWKKLNSNQIDLLDRKRKAVHEEASEAAVALGYYHRDAAAKGRERMAELAEVVGNAKTQRDDAAALNLIALSLLEELQALRALMATQTLLAGTRELSAFSFKSGGSARQILGETKKTNATPNRNSSVFGENR